MSDISMLKPPKIGVASQGSAPAQILGAARRDNAPAVKPKTPSVQAQNRVGQYGAPQGITINRRGEAPVTKLPPQTLTVLTSTLTTLVKFCKSENADAATLTASRCLALVRQIASGGTIADAPAAPPAPPSPTKAATPTASDAPQAPAEASGK